MFRPFPWPHKEVERRLLIEHDGVPRRSMQPWFGDPINGRIPQAGEPLKQFLRSGHPVVTIQGSYWSVARLNWYYWHGEQPEEVLHLDGNPRNNTYGNLAASDRRMTRQHRDRDKSINVVVMAAIPADDMMTTDDIAGVVKHPVPQVSSALIDLRRRGLVQFNDRHEAWERV